MTSDGPNAGTPRDGDSEYDHTVEVTRFATNQQITCPGCGTTYPEIVTDKVGGATCPECNDWIGYTRAGENDDQGTGDDTEQAKLLTDGGRSENDPSAPRSFEDCPNCDGDLEYPTQADVMCRDCESLFIHEIRGVRHLLWKFTHEDGMTEVVACAE